MLLQIEKLSLSNVDVFTLLECTSDEEIHPAFLAAWLVERVCIFGVVLGLSCRPPSLQVTFCALPGFDL